MRNLTLNINGKEFGKAIEDLAAVTSGELQITFLMIGQKSPEDGSVSYKGLLRTADASVSVTRGFFYPEPEKETLEQMKENAGPEGKKPGLNLIVDKKEFVEKFTALSKMSTKLYLTAGSELVVGISGTSTKVLIPLKEKLEKPFPAMEKTKKAAFGINGAAFSEVIQKGGAFPKPDNAMVTFQLSETELRAYSTNGGAMAFAVTNSGQVKAKLAQEGAVYFTISSDALNRVSSHFGEGLLQVAVMERQVIVRSDTAIYSLTQSTSGLNTGTLAVLDKLCKDAYTGTATVDSGEVLDLLSLLRLGGTSRQMAIAGGDGKVAMATESSRGDLKSEDSDGEFADTGYSLDYVTAAVRIFRKAGLILQSVAGKNGACMLRLSQKGDADGAVSACAIILPLSKAQTTVSAETSELTTAKAAPEPETGKEEPEQTATESETAEEAEEE